MLAALVVLLRTLGLLCSGHRAVALENVALRQQLSVLRRTVGRPHLRTSDRLFWVLLAKAWQDWRTALIVVQPDTVVRWHRQWLSRRWTQRSIRTRPGRPSTTAAIRTLIDQMTEANPLWGAPRIHGELGKLGIVVSERTVSRLLQRRRRPPSQTWRTFLTNHVASLVSMDFFTVPTLTGRVLFVLVLLTHDRRRIVHLAVTEHPLPHGRRNRSSRPFRTTPRRGGCYGIAMPSTGRCSGAVSPAWASRRSSPVHQVLGKIRMRRD
jgi:putative transposase